MVEVPSLRPRAGIDYPRDRIEFTIFFLLPGRRACVAHLWRAR
jgi:hypothetical protein